MAEQGGAAPREARFGYFVLHVRADQAPGEVCLALVLEDLATGEKHRFEGGAALGAFLDSWRFTPVPRRT